MFFTTKYEIAFSSITNNPMVLFYINNSEFKREITAKIKYYTSGYYKLSIENISTKHKSFSMKISETTES